MAQPPNPEIISGAFATLRDQALLIPNMPAPAPAPAPAAPALAPLAQEVGNLTQQLIQLQQQVAQLQQQVAQQQQQQQQQHEQLQQQLGQILEEVQEVNERLASAEALLPLRLYNASISAKSDIRYPADLDVPQGVILPPNKRRLERLTAQRCMQTANVLGLPLLDHPNLEARRQQISDYLGCAIPTP